MGAKSAKKKINKIIIRPDRAKGFFRIAFIGLILFSPSDLPMRSLDQLKDYQ